MDKDDQYKDPNDDLIENIDEEEMYELVREAQREALLEQQENSKSKRPFPKWIFWIVVMAMGFQAIFLLFQTFSLPAIDFLKTSAELSAQEDIKAFKKAVVVIAGDESRGTGFSVSSDGVILTNNHVIEGKDKVIVAFPDDGLFKAKVVETHPDVDLAILETNGENLPYLELAERKAFASGDSIQLIGNPLGFQGIANEGVIIDTLQLESWEEEVVMVKAPIYRGNSGSPVINKQGLVIGVVFATYNHAEYGKVGLFVPTEKLKQMEASIR